MRLHTQRHHCLVHQSVWPRPPGALAVSARLICLDLPGRALSFDTPPVTQNGRHAGVSPHRPPTFRVISRL